MNPNDNLEGYFQLQDKIKLKELREKREKALQEESIKERKELHWMHCPKCGAEMEVIKIDILEVDRCTECLGLYFDHSELEQLLEAEASKKKGMFGKLLGL